MKRTRKITQVCEDHYTISDLRTALRVGENCRIYVRVPGSFVHLPGSSKDLDLTETELVVEWPATESEANEEADP